MGIRYQFLIPICISTLVGILILPIPLLFTAPPTFNLYVGLVFSFIWLGGIPWLLFNFFTAIAISWILRLLKRTHVAIRISSGAIVWMGISIPLMRLLLQQQKQCDTLCFGLENLSIASIPAYALILISFFFLGCFQGSLLWRKS